MKKRTLREYIDDRIKWLNRLIDMEHDPHGCYERRTELQGLMWWMDENGFRKEEEDA